MLYANQFPNEVVKILFIITYFGKAALNWVQPRIEDYLNNPES